MYMFEKHCLCINNLYTYFVRIIIIIYYNIRNTKMSYNEF